MAVGTWGCPEAALNGFCCPGLAAAATLQFRHQTWTCSADCVESEMMQWRRSMAETFRHRRRRSRTVLLALSMNRFLWFSGIERMIPFCNLPNNPHYPSHLTSLSNRNFPLKNVSQLVSLSVLKLDSSLQQNSSLKLNFSSQSPHNEQDPRIEAASTMKKCMKTEHKENRLKYFQLKLHFMGQQWAC